MDEVCAGVGTRCLWPSDYSIPIVYRFGRIMAAKAHEVARLWRLKKHKISGSKKQVAFSSTFDMLNHINEFCLLSMIPWTQGTSRLRDTCCHLIPGQLRSRSSQEL